MTTTIVYDSGAGAGLPANVWGAYSVSSDPAQPPREVAISVVPVNTPLSGWNLAGWASLTTERDSTIYACQLTPVGLLPVISTLPYSLLNTEGVPRSGGALTGFRSVRWNIHRWVGPCRVRIVFFR